MRNCMERPPHLACAEVVRADVARSTRQPLGHSASNDQQVFVDDPWGCQDDRLFCRIASNTLSQVYPPIHAEARDRLAGSAIQRIDKVRDRREDAPLAAVGPVSDSAVRPAPDDAGIEAPDRLTCGGV